MVIALQKHVPALRFKDELGKEYPDWEEVKFSNLYSFKATNSYSREKLNYEKGKVRNIHYGDIHTKYKASFILNKEYVPFLNPEINLSAISKEAYCEEGDLVIADASEDYDGVGKTIELLDLNDELVLAGLHTLLARRKSNKIHIGYGTYVMVCNFVRRKIMRIAQGAKVLGISIGRMNELELPIPSKVEQKKIAAFLSSVDTKIEQLNKKKISLEQYKKGMMQKLFSQEIRFKDEHGEDYPDWESMLLGEVSVIKSGESNRADSGLDGKYIFFDRSQDIRTSDKYLFDAEAVIVAGEGQSFVPKYFIGKFDLHQRSYAIMDFRIAVGKFVFYFVTYNKHYFLSMAVGSTVKSLRLPMFQRMPIHWPCVEEQQKISAFLSVIDKKILLITKQLKQAQIFKKGLLQQMFV